VSDLLQQIETRQAILAEEGAPLLPEIDLEELR
jgi:hypothetical protein